MTMPHHVSMLDFARTGTLGPITIGMSRERLRVTVGPPDDWAAGGTMSRAGVWLYGNIEVHFADDEVFLVHSDTFETPTFNRELILDSWIIRAGLGLAELEAGLRDADVIFETDAYHFEAYAVKVTTAAGLAFFVKTQADEGDDLRGLWAFNRT